MALSKAEQKLKAQLQQLWEVKQLSVYEIMNILNLSRSTIYYKIKKFGLKRHNAPKSIYLEMIKSGKTVAEIANTFKCSSTTIYKKLKEYNITRPTSTRVV